MYKYHGTVFSFSYEDNGYKTIADIVLGEISDREKPPVRLTAHGALAGYINNIEMTDAEERYIQSNWYYDSNLFLDRIEVPSSRHIPAKVIAQADFLSDELVLFGPQDYIETDSPGPMDDEQYAGWLRYRAEHC
ncbi:hypothetical protein [uncultured Oscillibacter sp.]|uniref:hypothetical protein n=1 Tax=uncultured Oscillibacter sp. TaxID=876091 RepID=UPI0025FC8A35|nr:hypothetical protein [uncultured Oscillibacter sp.]